LRYAHDGTEALELGLQVTRRIVVDQIGRRRRGVNEIVRLMPSVRPDNP
jgi:hypothetical protein